MPDTRYRITVLGRISDRFLGPLDGLAVHADGSVTVISGTIRDQSELYGVLNRLQAIGAELLTVRGPDLGTTKADEPTDGDLLAAAAVGEEAAFGHLLARHGAATARLVHAITAREGPAEAGRACDSVLVEAWRQVLVTGRLFGRASLRPLLFHAVIDVVRRTGPDLVPWEREGAREPDWSAAEAASPAGAPTLGGLAAGTDPRAIVRAALAAVPSGPRVVLILRDVEGWRARDVCRLLGIGERQQRALLHRGRCALRAQTMRAVAA